MIRLSFVSRGVAFAFALAGSQLLCATPAIAQSSGGGADSGIVARPAPPAGAQLRQIRLVGAQRTTIGTVRDVTGLIEGDRLSSDGINAAIKALFSTGRFVDVQARLEGGVLTFRLEEAPIISRVAFEGNQFLKEADLLELIDLGAGDVLTPALIAQKVSLMSAAYRQAGYFAASIEPQYVDTARGRVDLVFEINERERGRIGTIRFIGNEAFSDSTLMQVISARETAWFRFLSSADIFTPERLEFDRRQLEQYYFDAGYPQFRIVSATYEVPAHRDEVDLVFVLSEGRKFEIGAVTIDNQVTGLSNQTLASVELVSSGDLFSRRRLRDSLQSLSVAAHEAGFPFALGDVLVNLEEQAGLANITYLLIEGPRRIVRRIEIRGNDVTEGNVIRRYLPVVEGDAFSPVYIEQIRQRLLRTRLFSEVEVIVEQVGEEEVLLVVDVAEQASGALTASVGYSTLYGIVGTLGWSENNVLGTGNAINISVERNGPNTNYRVAYTDPYFLDRNLVGTILAYRTQVDTSALGSYSRSDLGLELDLGMKLTDSIRLTVGYNLQETKISDVKDDASLLVKRAPARSVTSAILGRVAWDNLDNPISPTAGWRIGGSAEVAGIGGTKKFVKLGASATNYSSLFDDAPQVVLTNRLTLGAIVPYDNYEVQVTDRFFAGGGSFWGFEDAGIGPRDSVSGDPVGGNYQARLATDLRFPVFGEVLQGIAFSRVGTVFGGSNPPQNDEEGKAEFLVEKGGGVRVAVGLALQMETPIAPLVFSYGVPISKASYDKVKNFSFSFGGVF